MAKRLELTVGFKVRVAKEALRGGHTVRQEEAEYEVHPNQMRRWKRNDSEGLVELFESDPSGVREALKVIYCRPHRSEPHRGHWIYPYLLRHLVVERSIKCDVSWYRLFNYPVPAQYEPITR